MPTQYTFYRPGERRPLMQAANALQTIEALVRDSEPDHEAAPTREFRCGNDRCSVRGVIVRQSSEAHLDPPPCCPCCRTPLTFVSFLRSAKFVPVAEGDR